MKISAESYQMNLSNLIEQILFESVKHGLVDLVPENFSRTNTQPKNHWSVLSLNFRLFFGSKITSEYRLLYRLLDTY